MPDLRPRLSGQAFEELARRRREGWWLNGNGLIAAVAQLRADGVDVYAPDNAALLTHAQRVLSVWCDLVGQVQNGGVQQFCDNLPTALPFAARAIPELDWPALSQRFGQALAEHAEANRPVALTDEPEKWTASRQRLPRFLAPRHIGRSWLITRRDLDRVAAAYEDWELQDLYQRLVRAGKMPSGGEAVFKWQEPPSDAAEAFDDWFLDADTREVSGHFIPAYILANRDALALIDD